jgi:hypothetical protein
MGVWLSGTMIVVIVNVDDGPPVAAIASPLNKVAFLVAPLP